MTSQRDITRLLKALADGDHSAETELIPLVYDELRRLAGRYMRREAAGHTLQTTALVHEAYLRLVRPSKGSWENRSHFYGVAATVMRHILVDHARARSSGKRQENAAINIDFELAPEWGDASRLIALDEALERLGRLDERQCRIVELRFFAGMTVDETADVLGMSPRSVKRHWQLARAWLYGELSA